ncbi:hypothetical protein GOODEAATRI_015701, partial [Goodea atripinnis]
DSTNIQIRVCCVSVAAYGLNCLCVPATTTGLKSYSVNSPVFTFFTPPFPHHFFFQGSCLLWLLSSVGLTHNDDLDQALGKCQGWWTDCLKAISLVFLCADSVSSLSLSPSSHLSLLFSSIFSFSTSLS